MTSGFLAGTSDTTCAHVTFLNEKKAALAAAVGKVLAEVGREDLPVVMGVDCGHMQPMTALPLGARVAVDARTRTFELLEPGVV